MLISLVVPVFNEESAIPLSLPKLEITFVNDGSSDNTGAIITK